MPICRLAVFFVFLFTVPAVLAKDPPAWMKTAAALSVPTYEKDVPAVVLHSDYSVTYDSSGKLVTTENYAVKMLNKEGASYAMATAYYLVSAGRIRDIEAWIIRPNGTNKEYGKKDIVDIIADRNDVYNEGRIKSISAVRDVDTGFVFGYTIVSEDTPLFYQDIHRFQDRLPALMSRYSLTLPAGWKAVSQTFNHAELEPRVSGNTYTWELRDLPPIPPEPLSPSLINLAPRIAVNFSPANVDAAGNKVFSTWLDVSRWATALYEPQVVITPAITAKTREVTAGANTELEKIRAVGNFVQNLQYISIDIGVGHGNGYKPRASDVVLNRGYGDCKDKANLMRAMLKTIGIEAYPVIIYSGDPTYVRASWASPRQFNHCIIAVKISDETTAPPVLMHPQLGRLLIFDATDSFTPVGDLPDYLQGSQAVILAGENGGLFEMPITDAEVDLLERTVKVGLDPSGQLSGTISEKANGQTSTAFRQEVRALSASDYRRAIEGWLTRGSTGAKLLDLDIRDNEAEARLELDVKFESPRYGQLMQNRLMVFKPVVIGRRNAVAFTEPKRKNPIELESMLMRETVEIKLPEGFDVDEMPDPVKLESEFGSYVTNYEVNDRVLLFSRSYQLNRALVPAERYDAVRQFFAKMLDAEQSAIVLVRK